MEQNLNKRIETFNFFGQGEIYSYSIVYEPPAGFEEFVPYVIALIKLEEGPLITAQLTDIDFRPDEKGRPVMDFSALYIGMKVEMVTRKLSQDGDKGLINYGYKFRPCMEGR